MSGPILPGATIGVVGGGQLGRMLSLEARRMGYRVLVLDPGEDAPAAQVADEQIRAPLDDADAARELARRSDVVTLEWENADVETLRELERFAPVRPGAHVLEVAQHRRREKEEARRLGLPTAEFHPVLTRADLDAGVALLGLPAILKTARGGYDGKGQVVIREAGEVAGAFQALGGESRELILERMVRFRMEASVICARSPRGEVRTFPIAENLHRRGILDVTVAPARLPEALQRRAREIGETLVEGLDVVGLLAAELFIDEDDRVLVNEIAPRPHNSGHFTWEACAVSQFEQQLRAICDLPLAAPDLLRAAAMANLLGEDLAEGEHLPGLGSALEVPSVTLHLYGKREARTGRKMGHLTALAEEPETALERVRRARELLRGPAGSPPR